MIDINRNHRSQTCASPYSVRGKEGAPVSTPIRWEDFGELKSSQQYNIRNIFEYLEKVGGDPWGKINSPLTPEGGIASELIPNLASNSIHQIGSQEYSKENLSSIKSTPPSGVGGPSTPPSGVGGAGLSSYSFKRNFEKTTEPAAEIIPNTTGILRYVIQKHDASNLHYDLRLEHEGMLLSWAIPKALPNHPHEKRLAIQTEPHPMKYIDFEGRYTQR